MQKQSNEYQPNESQPIYRYFRKALNEKADNRNNWASAGKGGG